MFNRRTSTSMLRIWTWRYAFVLLITMCLIGIIATLWIRYNNNNKSFAVLEARAEQFADIYSRSYTDTQTNNDIDSLQTQSTIKVSQIIKPLEGEVLLLLGTRKENKVVSIKEKIITNDENEEQSVALSSKNNMLNPPDFSPVLKGKTIKKQYKHNGELWQSVAVPLSKQNDDISGISLSAPVKIDYKETKRMYIYVSIIIIGIAIVAWCVIYLLLRKLTRPMSQLAHAAIQVADGDYTPNLPSANNIKELELQQLIHSFKEMTTKLKALEQMRTDLLAGVSHELRTPLTSIRGMIQAVNNRVVEKEEADEFLHISLDEAKRMQRMIDNLLDFSSLEAGAVQANSSIIDFTQLIKSIMKQLRSTPSFYHVHIDIPIEDNKIYGDEGQIKQILINLMMNSVIAGATEISFRCEVLDNQMMIDVRDNGKGIEESEVPFIFERYYQGNSKRNKKKGLGLGLPLCRLYARANNGDIILLSTSTQGSVFRLILPNVK
ncbi:histidine kinase dimerization/phospho-acceptor domain-containing protein [Bacillus sp. 1P06AnD]|uniref:HAMP domain-containing sensor histidine kinase n=1 Tax=Bacillus sp. 1P06AnD TaxID=3132208 RepID=UPI0039A270B9